VRQGAPYGEFLGCSVNSCPSLVK
jgi:hypothetical protein